MVPVGGISIGINKKGASLLASIWVDPKHQGKGLSKYLYKYACEQMAERGIQSYIGYTSTQQVLKIGKKIGRKAIGLNYFI